MALVALTPNAKLSHTFLDAFAQLGSRETHSLAVSELYNVRVLNFYRLSAAKLNPVLTCFCKLFSVIEPERTPCSPSPCGVNAICKERNGAGACSCVPDFHGDPYVECRPECVMNSECPKNRACKNTKCVDPCPGTCGFNAQCHVFNHAPTCTCIQGYTGNPATICHPPQPRKILKAILPCRTILIKISS